MRRKFAFKLMSFLVFTLLSLNVDAAILKFEKTKGDVNFLAVGNPGFLKVNGKGSGVQGTLTVENTDAKGEFQFDLESLDTGIGLRNKHMKEKYLETPKYPTATFKISDLKLSNFNSDQAEIKNQPFKGTLKLHNVENEVSGTFSAKKSGKEISGLAEFDIPLSKYQIDIPSYAGVTVAESVKVKITFSPAPEEDQAAAKKQ